jgi:hypothetical protein
LIFQLTRRLTSDLRQLLSPPIGQLSGIRLSPHPFSLPLPTMNFRSHPDLASPAEPSMSIQSPPSIASPDTLAVNLRFSPSAYSSNVASPQFAAFAGVCILAEPANSSPALAFDSVLCSGWSLEPPNRFGSPILQPIRQSSPDSLPGHQLKETVRLFHLWMQV